MDHRADYFTLLLLILHLALVEFQFSSLVRILIEHVLAVFSLFYLNNVFTLQTELSCAASRLVSHDLGLSGPSSRLNQSNYIASYVTLRRGPGGSAARVSTGGTSADMCDHPE